MENNVRKMMSACPHAIELPVNRMRKKREGVPICGNNRREKPFEENRTESRLDVSVFENIGVVIEVNKLKENRRSIEDESSYN